MALLRQFKEEVCTTALAENEAMEDLHWFDMSVGWFLARGANVSMAFRLAAKARYKFGYWQDQ